MWTEKDENARTIQKYVRRHLAKNELQKLKNQKQDYDDLMEKLQKEVFNEMSIATSQFDVKNRARPVRVWDIRLGRLGLTMDQYRDSALLIWYQRPMNTPS